MTADPKELIELCAITNAHGIKGEVTIKLFGYDPEALLNYGPLTDKSGQKTFTIQKLRPGKKELLVGRIKEITDRNQAEAVKGTELYIERSKLPEPDEDEDEFYYRDLVGLTVKTNDEELYGKVIAVENFGAGDIIEIMPQNSQKSVYFSFTKEIVPVVSIKEGYITLNPPAEILVTEEEAEQNLKQENTETTDNNTNSD